MRLLIVMTLLACAGCEKDYVEVQCQGGGDAVDCTLRHTKGSRTVNACFELAIQCRNGTKPVARACQNGLSAGAVATRTLKDADFSNADKCDDVISTAVQNVTISESH